MELNYHGLFYKWRDYDLYSTFFAMAGLGISCACLEYNIDRKLPNMDPDNVSAMDDPRNHSMFT